MYALALARLQDQLGSAQTPPSARSPRAGSRSSWARALPAPRSRLVEPGHRHARLVLRLHHPPRLDGQSPAAGLERRRLRAGRDGDAQRRAIAKPELSAFLNTEHPLREKTLWWLLYETAARASEILALNVEDLDMPRRRAVVIGKGGRAEPVGWETKTARLLPRHLRHRTSGPLFLADIAPRRHVNPRSPTSTLTPGAPGCPTAAPRSSSQRPRAAGRSTSCATPGSPTSPSTASNCRSCSPRAATPASAASGSTPNPPSTPSPRPPRRSIPTAATEPRGHDSPSTSTSPLPVRLPRFVPLSNSGGRMVGGPYEPERAAGWARTPSVSFRAPGWRA